MAASRKYAGLPDLDPAPEIYETPELTADASTLQTSTLRTESPTPSEDGRQNEHFDRARLNQDEARRRFEPTIVNSKDTNLSDAIGGNRKGYITTHRRRRRRIRKDNGAEETGDLSDLSSDEEETLSKKLARLRREAEEIRLELAEREKEVEEGEFRDSVEQQQQQQDGEQIEDPKELLDGVDQLNQVLNGLKVRSRPSGTTSLEQEFSRHLAPDKPRNSDNQQNGVHQNDDNTSMSNSSIAAITAFSDRLTALETALGLSSISSATNTASILPTLDILTTQVSSLHTVIDPKPTATNAQRDHLETLTNRLHALHAEADKMLNTRKAALQALNQLHEARYSGANHNSTAFAKYLSKREARQRDSQTHETTTTSTVEDATNNNNTHDETNRTRSRSKSKDPAATGTSAMSRGRAAAAAGGGGGNNDNARDIDVSGIEDRVFTDVFLEEQASKISALYSTLPTIQNLQPLLPVVLERLRGLSVIHASAATAHDDMQDLEARLSQWETNITKWRTAVEGVERGIEESKIVMKENLDVVSGMVNGLETRMDEINNRTKK